MCNLRLIYLVKSSPAEVFVRKGPLKICSTFTGEHPCRSVISLQLFCSFIGITFRHGCSPVKLLHIFKTPFPNNTSGGLLLLGVFHFLVFCKCSFNHGDIKNFHDCYTCTSKPGRNWFLYLYKVYHSWFLLYI